MCATCSAGMARKRGCADRGMPPRCAPAPAPFVQELPGGRKRSRYECPRHHLRRSDSDLYRMLQHHRAGRLLYPTILDYPDLLLRRLEVLDDEIRSNIAAQLEAQQREAKCRP